MTTTNYDTELSQAVKPLSIKVVGAGGGGSNSINRLRRIGVYGAETVAINTDAMHLRTVSADKVLLIGKKKTRGHGAGGKPEIGEECADESRDDIAAVLKGADIVFLTAGMGGGTGTGSAPVVAEVAKEQGAVVIALVTTPFEAEKARHENAKMGVDRLRRCTDSLILLDNNRLLRLCPRLAVDEAFSVMDQLISETIKSVTESITKPSLINIDFADLKTILEGGETATILYGENSAREPERVVADAINNPFLDIDLSGATGALIHVTSGMKLSIGVVNQVVAGITMPMDASANVIFGARQDPDYEDTIKVSAIVTGASSPQLPSLGMTNEDAAMVRILEPAV